MNIFKVRVFLNVNYMKTIRKLSKYNTMKCLIKNLSTLIQHYRPWVRIQQDCLETSK